MPHWLPSPSGRARQEYALSDVLLSAIAIVLEAFEPLAKLVWTSSFACYLVGSVLGVARVEGYAVGTERAHGSAILAC